ncbi:MAG: hypothetical protein RJQ09_17085 [Cyclobacteriaceae bacterium]
MVIWKNLLKLIVLVSISISSLILIDYVLPKRIQVESVRSTLGRFELAGKDESVRFEVTTKNKNEHILYIAESEKFGVGDRLFVSYSFVFDQVSQIIHKRSGNKFMPATGSFSYFGIAPILLFFCSLFAIKYWNKPESFATPISIIFILLAITCAIIWVPFT